MRLINWGIEAQGKGGAFNGFRLCGEMVLTGVKVETIPPWTQILQLLPLFSSSWDQQVDFRG